MKDKFYHYIQQLQDTITSKLEAVDGLARFKEDLKAVAEELESLKTVLFLKKEV